MALTQLILQNFLSFVFIISLIVFIHEFGHFFVARLCGVKVDQFAIGFGKKLFGFKDKKGTEWKICLLPFGGYVKMHGDRNGASMPDLKEIKKMSPAEIKKSFFGKNVFQRIAIVAAGPIANFLLTIFIFTILFRINGLNTALPIVEGVLPESAAFMAGLQKGDKILTIDGVEIKEFEDVRNAVTKSREQELLFKIQRNEETFEIKIAPKIQTRTDFFGEEVKIATLGVGTSAIEHKDLNLGQSFLEANKETYNTTIAILKAFGELITGQRSVKELGGPVKIAKYSGKSVEMGALTVLWFMAMISLNLGVMNLLPIPVLDGGHLFYYVIEAIRGKPLSQKIQQIGFQIGLALVATLMIFTTINDIGQLIK